MPQTANEDEINKAKQIFQEVSDNIPEENSDDFLKQFKKYINDLVEDIKANLGSLSSDFIPKVIAEEYLEELVKIAKQSDKVDIIKGIINNEKIYPHG